MGRWEIATLVESGLCPYCGAQFLKPPLRKTRCSSCGNMPRVCTSPIDNKRYLITEADAEEFFEYRQLRALSSRVVRSDREGFLALRDTLAAAGHPTSDLTATVQLLERSLVALPAAHLWGLYRNAVLELAWARRLERRLSESAALLLEVCYLDLNDPHNVGDLARYQELAREYPPFGPELAQLLPAIAQEANDALIRANLDIDAGEQLFLMVASDRHSRFPLWLSPAEGWAHVKDSLHLAGAA